MNSKIKLKLTKDKLGAIIQGITDITEALKREVDQVKFDMKKMEMNAERTFLEDLKERLQLKHIQMSFAGKYNKSPLTFSFNSIEAFLLVKYSGYGFNPNAEYQFAVMAEISDPICKTLL